jgi:hypothetical protein
MTAGGSVLSKATPDDARRVWEVQQRPSCRTVARALTLAGRPVHPVTVARWRARDWKPVKTDHPLEIARSRLESVVPLVTGNAETTIQDLIDDPAHNCFDSLSDGEVLRRATRELAIATTLVAKAIKDHVTESDFDLLELMPALFAIGQSMRAIPGGFEQAIDLQEAEQRNKGLQT